MRKIPFLDAQQEFIKRGYEPLFSEEFYKTCNNKTPLPYRCPHHPKRENKICLSSLKSGHGCAWCAGKAKATFLEAQQEFIKRGYEPLFSEEFYKKCNSATPLPYRCPHHPARNNKIRLNDLKSGKGCAWCSGNAKTPFPDAIQEFIKRGYEPLFSEEFYRTCNNATPLPYRCPHHPTRNNKISLNDLKKGHGCSKCGREAAAEKNKIPFPEAQQEFIKRGYEPLFGEEFYRTCNGRTPLPYRCPHHPTRNNKISLNHLKSGSGCAWCVGKAKATFLEAQQEFIKRGYEPLFDEEFYKKCNTKTPLPYRCPRHPTRNNKICLNSLKKGHGCASCNESKGEKLVAKCCEKLSINFDTEVKFKECKDKRRLPFDLYLPDHKVLIEVDGDDHYEESYKRNKNYSRFSQKKFEGVKRRDAIKTKFAKDYGYELIRFKHTIDDPLTDHEDYVLSILSHYTNRK